LYAAVLRSSGEILVSIDGHLLVNTNKGELLDLANDIVLSAFIEIKAYMEQTSVAASAKPTKAHQAQQGKNPKRVAAGIAAAKKRWGKKSVAGKNAARVAAGRAGARKRWAAVRAAKAKKRG
jgi:predicted lipid-binding transport protein (Tim44 family)